MAKAKREPKTVQVDGDTYLVGGIAPRKAFHVFRKLLPFLGALAPTIKRLFGEKAFGEIAEAAAKASGTADAVAGAGLELPEDLDLMDVGIEAGKAVIRALAEMSEEDADYVLDHLLAGAKFVTPGGGAVNLVEGGKLKATELAWETQVALAKESAVFNFSDFYGGLPSDLQEKARTLTALSLG